MGTKRRIVRMMTLVAVLGFLGGGLAWAGHKIYVDPDDCPVVGADGSKGNPFCTIEEALFLASEGDHITVRAGTYRGGVEIPGSKDFLLLDADPGVIIDCDLGGLNGITVFSDGNYVQDFVIKNCAIGILLNDSTSGNFIDDNEFVDNGIGIWVSGKGNKIEDNWVKDSTLLHGVGDGIVVQGVVTVAAGEMNVLEDNKVEGSDGWGIVVRSDDNVLENNKVWGNTLGGIKIEGTAPDTMLTNNDATDNGGDGFQVDEAAHTHFVQNHAAGNKANGFNIRGDAFETVLVDNWAKGNMAHGISLTLFDGDSPRDTMLLRNFAEGNTFDGFHLEGEVPNPEEDDDGKECAVLMRNRAGGPTVEMANGGHGFNTDAANNNNVYVKNDASGNGGAGMKDVNSSGSGTAGTDNNYTANDCAANTLGDSNLAGLCN